MEWGHAVILHYSIAILHNTTDNPTMRSFLVLSLVCGLVSAGFLSNTKHAFKEGDAINLKVNGLFSSKTRIPYEYYYLPLPKVSTLRCVWL